MTHTLLIDRLSPVMEKHLAVRTHQINFVGKRIAIGKRFYTALKESRFVMFDPEMDSDDPDVKPLAEHLKVGTHLSVYACEETENERRLYCMVEDMALF